MSLIRISESNDWFVDYDRERGMYRVSYFQDNHFVDEHWFDAYEEKEVVEKTTDEKWYFLKDRLPPLGELVRVRVIKNGRKEYYLDELIPMKNGTYSRAFQYYGDMEIAWTYCKR